MSLKRMRIALIVVSALTLAGFGAAWLGSRPFGSPLTAAPPGKAVSSEKDPKSPQVKKVEKANPEPTESWTVDLRKKLDRIIDFSGQDADKETKLDDFLTQLQLRFKITIDINEKAFASEKEDSVHVRDLRIGDPHPLPNMKATLDAVLRKILSRIPGKSPATYMLRKGGIEITTESAVRDELGLDDDARVWPMISDDFLDIPLADVLVKIADTSDSTILVDPRTETQSTKKITARLRNVPVETALQLLSDMAGLEVVRMANAFYVTTPQNAVRLRKKEAP